MRGAVKTLGRILGIAGISYVAIAALAYVFQRRLLYFPDPSSVTLPLGARYHGIEEFVVTTEDNISLRGWYWPGSRPVDFLVFHGNGGNRWHRLDWLEDLHAQGFGSCMVDYRGYGGSTGSPTEAGLYRDARAAHSWLRRRSRAKLVYFGESLGCAVAVDLAGEHPPAGIILQSSFSAAVDVAQRAYPFLPVRLLMRDRYDSVGKLRAIAAPLIVIHGTADSIVPIDLARSLYEAAPGPKEWLEIPGADHNELPWVSPRVYWEAIGRFVRERVDRP